MADCFKSSLKFFFYVCTPNGVHLFDQTIFHNQNYTLKFQIQTDPFLGTQTQADCREAPIALLLRRLDSLYVIHWDCLYCSIYCSMRLNQKKAPNNQNKICPIWSGQKGPKGWKDSQRVKTVERSLSEEEKLGAVFLSTLQPCGHFLAENGDGVAVFTTK